MRYLVLLLIFINFSCTNLKANQENNIITMKIDTFDIKKIKDFISSGGNTDPNKKTYTMYTSIGDTIIEEKSIYIIGKEKKFYSRDFVPPAPNMYVINRQYDDSGLIYIERDRLCKIFLGFKYGVFKYFNKEGEIEKVEDFTKKYDVLAFNLDSLMNKLEQTRVTIGDYSALTIERAKGADMVSSDLENKETIKEELRKKELGMIGLSTEAQVNYCYLNPYDSEDMRRLKISINWKTKEWEVTKRLGFGRAILYCSYETGKVLREEYLIYFVEID